MPRPAKPRWSHPRQAWISSVGEISEKSGRRLPVAFRIGRDGRPLGPKDRIRAGQVLDDYLAERETRVIVGGDFTFGQLCTLYLDYSQRNAAPNTYRGHRKVLRLVQKVESGRQTLGEKLAREFTATDLDRVVVAWAEADRKPTYIARMVASVQAVFNWAAAPVPKRDPERLIAANPLKGYRSVHCQIPDAPDRYASDDEVSAFLKWGRDRARKIGGLAGRFDRLTIEIIYAMSLTGARPGELCAALWNDFSPRKVQDKTGQWWGLIVFPPKRHKTGGKTGKPREIYCPAPLVRTILAIGRLKGRHPEFIWSHRRGARAATRGADVATQGEPWNSNALSRRIKQLRLMAIDDGVPLANEGDNRFVAYRLRHTAAAKLLMSGEDIYTVAKLLGTSAAMIQRRYGSILRGRLADAAGGLTNKDLSKRDSLAK
jgi:integrase